MDSTASGTPTSTTSAGPSLGPSVVASADVIPLGTNGGSQATPAAPPVMPPADVTGDHLPSVPVVPPSPPSPYGPSLPSAPIIGPPQFPLFGLGFPVAPSPPFGPMLGRISNVVGTLTNQITAQIQNSLTQIGNTIVALQQPILANISAQLQALNTTVSTLISVVHDLTVKAGTLPPAPIVPIVQQQFPSYPYPGIQPPLPSGPSYPQIGVPPSGPPTIGPSGPSGPTVTPSVTPGSPAYPCPQVPSGISVPMPAPGTSVCITATPQGPQAQTTTGPVPPATGNVSLTSVIDPASLAALSQSIATAVAAQGAASSPSGTSLSPSQINQLVANVLATIQLPSAPSPQPAPPPSVVNVYPPQIVNQITNNVAGSVTSAVANATGGSVNVDPTIIATAIANALPTVTVNPPSQASGTQVSGGQGISFPAPPTVTSPPSMLTIDQLDALIPGSGVTPFTGETFLEEGERAVYPLEFGTAAPGVVEPPLAEPYEKTGGTDAEWFPPKR